MYRYTIYFDATLRTCRGKHVPFWDTLHIEKEHPAHDKDLVWFHEGYGKMALYRLHKVDEENYIAEKMNKYVSTSNPNCKKLLAHPELVLAS